MNEIPLEVFINIAFYLTFKEKLALSSASHHCHDMIKATNLYNKFRVKGKKNFELATEYFKSHHQYANQVRDLFLVKPSADIKCIISIPSTFPHLQQFFYADYNNSEEEFDISEEAVKSWLHVKEFQEINRHSICTPLLQSGCFANLTKLKVNFHFGYADCTILFRHLSNAPNLKQLELDCILLSLETLEILHENTTHLQSLRLESVMQEARDFDLSYEEEQELLNEEYQDTAMLVRQQERLTKPATTIEYLEIQQMKMDDNLPGIESRWLTYIAKKYVNLKSLIIGGIGMGKLTRPFYEEKLVGIISACQALEQYKVNIFPLSSSILDMMDKNHIELQEIDVLGNVEDQLSNLANSNQKHSLRSIIIKDDSLLIDKIMTYLEQFSNLRSLVLESKNRSNTISYVPIDTLIGRLKSMVSLSILSCKVGLDNKDMPSLSKLHSLVFDKALIINNDSAIIKYIAQACPSLSRLKIHGQLENNDDTASFNIHFTDQYFTSLRVLILGNEHYVVNNGTYISCYQFRGRLFQRCDNTEHISNVSIKYRGLAVLNIGGVNIPKW